MLQLVPGGFLKSVSEDDNPKLGGNLDGGGHNITNVATATLVNLVVETISTIHAIEPKITFTRTDLTPDQTWAFDIISTGAFRIRDEKNFQNCLRINTNSGDNAIYVVSSSQIKFLDGTMALKDGKLGLGTVEPTKKVDAVIADDTNAAGMIIRNSDGSIRLVNGTGAENEFAPTYWGVSKGASKTTFLVGEITAADDSGTVAAFTIDGRRTGAALQTRPILEIRNYGTTVCVVDKIGRFGIQASAGAAQVCIRQYRSTATIPVLQLTQSDIDDTFVNYVGTGADDGSRSISTDTTEDSAKFGAVRCEINGVTKWIRIYDDHS